MSTIFRDKNTTKPPLKAFLGFNRHSEYYESKHVRVFNKMLFNYVIAHVICVIIDVILNVRFSKHKRQRDVFLRSGWQRHCVFSFLIDKIDQVYLTVIFSFGLVAICNGIPIFYYRHV